MSDLSREQEQAIARSTMYLVAALLSIVMICIAGLFLSAELEQQGKKPRQHSRSHFNKRSLLKPSGHGLCGESTLMRILGMQR